jgi:hypothetical protein
MAIAPIFQKVPRYAFIVVSEAMSVISKIHLGNLFTFLSSLIPVAIVGATRFYTTFVDILSEPDLYSRPVHALLNCRKRLDRLLEFGVCSDCPHGTFHFPQRPL